MDGDVMREVKFNVRNPLYWMLVLYVLAIAAMLLTT